MPINAILSISCAILPKKNVLLLNKSKSNNGVLFCLFLRSVHNLKPKNRMMPSTIMTGTIRPDPTFRNARMINAKLNPEIIPPIISMLGLVEASISTSFSIPEKIRITTTSMNSLAKTNLQLNCDTIKPPNIGPTAAPAAPIPPRIAKAVARCLVPG